MMSMPPSPSTSSNMVPVTKTLRPSNGLPSCGSKLSLLLVLSEVPISIQSSPSLPNVGRLSGRRGTPLPVPPKVSEHALAGDDEVVAGAADDQVEAVAAALLPGPLLQDIVAADILVRCRRPAPPALVVAVAALEPVVAAVAPQRVVADAADEDVVAAGIERVAGVGVAEDDVLAARVLEVVGTAPRSGLSRMTTHRAR